MAARSEKVTFTGSQGDELAGRLELPEAEPLAYAVFAHCFTCSMDAFAASRVSKALTAHGIAVLRFDFTGIGNSEGDFANKIFSGNVEDLVRAADHLREEYRAPAILIGHSLGGAAVLRAAAGIKEAKAVATIAAPCSPTHVGQLFGDSIEEITDRGEAEVDIGGRRFTISKAFLDDIATQDMQDAIANLRKALMVFHSPLDNLVGVENAARIFEAAKHPKSFVSLDDADHLLNRREDAAYVADVLASWASRYIGAAEKEAPTDPEEGVVVVESTDGRFAQRIRAGRHELRADEPEGIGGDDSGPDPYGLLLSSLGACKSMTMQMYAERKGWPLEGTRVRLSHDRVHATDCEECETREGKVDRVDVEISLEGDLDEEQRERLLEISGRCPVHRTLTSETVIRSTLV